jgi:RNA polymerase sigma-70 factor (ECF subfamily)
MDDRSADLPDLLERARAGDKAALETLFTHHRHRLLKMVEVRLDRRVQARVDASDVVQEAYVDVLGRLNEYLSDPRLPFFLWLRLVVGDRVQKVHRHHLGTQARDAGREISINQNPPAPASSMALAGQLLGEVTSPSEAVEREERTRQLQEALDSLPAMDREIVALRHFEELTCAEAAQVLGIQEAAVAKRYVRALKRLREILSDPPAPESV